MRQYAHHGRSAPWLTVVPLLKLPLGCSVLIEPQRSVWRSFSWELAWDHAAGLLLVAEAGGAQTTVTGEPFRIAGGNALPFTAARDEATAERIRALLAAAAPEE
ncbi:inositol monophosphatase family protein [Streptomyces sp. NPDC057854]|uniref:inositol monophosphatase family protein n=1 Tax=unclassified Streptomyces TaxID=2593676 RepID=UPI0036892C6D